MVVSGAQTFHAGEGDVIVVSAGHCVDMRNIPDAAGVYEADAFTFGDDLLSASPSDRFGVRDLGSFRPPAGFQATLDSARNALNSRMDLPEPIIVHRVAELIVWVRTYGLHLTSLELHNLPARLRQLVSLAPGRPWRIAELASKLGMSEPSLRRHLAAEGTTATEIVADVRLTRALTQLQTSTRSVTQIALDAGYESPSRFAHRFRARFGVSPAQIRRKKKTFDRIGAEFDQTGTEGSSF